jgi:chromosome segregation ATPase
MTLNDAVAALKAHARQLEAVQTIAAAISDVAAIDQLTDEAEQRRVARQAEVDAAAARVGEMEAKLKDAQDKVLSANARANSIIEDAKQKAVSILEKANADAVMAGEQAAATARAEAAKWAAEAAAAMTEAAANRKAAEESFATLAARKAELAAIEDRIAKARELMTGFMG